MNPPAPALLSLLQHFGDSPMPLDAGVPNAASVDLIRTIEPADLLGRQVRRGDASADAAFAALHLRANDLEGAHKLCQAHEGDATNDMLHAIVHRREGDWWNSKYWLRRAAGHPLPCDLGDLLAGWPGRHVGPSLGPTWQRLLPAPVALPDALRRRPFDPAGFVDRCHQVVTGGSPADAAACLAVQQAEWALLVMQTCG